MDIFEQINNAVLDLQTATLQSYGYSLKRLGKLLRHSDLDNINQQLIVGLDLDEFISAGNTTETSWVGSASLNWSDDDRENLGLKLLLILKFSDNPDYMASFGHQYFYTGKKILGDVQAVTSQIIIPFVRDYKSHVISNGDTITQLIKSTSNSSKIFIVHGHDGEARELVARYLIEIGFEPIILHEQANSGRTIIEKIEANADVGFAIVLLTPDDEGRAKNKDKLEPRARQNVLLELGYFLARLGRDKVCALKKCEVEIPSDFAGVLWEEMDNGGGWKPKLARELKAAGYTIDWNIVMQ